MEKVRARCGQRSDSRTAKEQNRTFTRRHVCSDTDRPSTAISRHVAVDFCTTRSSAAVHCESWTLRKNKETRLDAFEMKGLRKSFCVFHGQQRKQISGFLTKLE